MYNSCFENGIMNSRIVAYAFGNVNGDRIYDNLYLAGTIEISSQFIQNITLLILNGKTGNFINVPLSLFSYLQYYIQEVSSKLIYNTNKPYLEFFLFYQLKI